MNDIIMKLNSLINIGFESVGSNYRSIIEDEIIICKNYIIEIEQDKFCCSEISFDQSKEIFSIDFEGITSFATMFVVRILTDIVIRHIEEQYEYIK